MNIIESLLSQIQPLPIDLFSMSLTGAAMIVIVMLIRSFSIHKLPKATFTVLWGVVLLRLFIPVSIPSRYSIYSLAERSMHNTGPLNNRNVPDSSRLRSNSNITDNGRQTNSSPLQSFNSTHSRSKLAADRFLSNENSIQDNRLSQDTTTPPHKNSIQNGNTSPDTFHDPHDQDQALTEPQPLPAWHQRIFAVLHTAAAKLYGWINHLPLQIIWLAGMTGCALFFAVSYVKCIQIFSMSLPADNSYVREWQDAHKIKRRIAVRQSAFVTAPLTYGILHPVILMPKDTDWKDTRQLEYIFTHEYVHIRRFDTVYKLFLTAACCIHWFNPLAWIMYLLANQDLELSCDEAVVHIFGDTKKSAYAHALIRMEEKKSGFAPLCSRFSKNKAEERITAIMKMKKTNYFKTAAACTLITCITCTFATTAAAEQPLTNTAGQTPIHTAGQPSAGTSQTSSVGTTQLPSADTAHSDAAARTQADTADADTPPASVKDAADLKSQARTDALKLSDAPKLSDIRAKKLSTVPGTKFTKSDYKKIAALCFDGFQNMTVSAYRSRVWDIIDTDEYLTLLAQMYQNETLLAQKDSHPAAYFLYYILSPLTAEKWKSWKFGGYAGTSCQNSIDSAAFEYEFMLTIRDADHLTIQEYDDARRNIVNAIETFFYGKSLDQLSTKNEKQMQAAIRSQIPHFENDFCPAACTASFTDWYYTPLFVYEPDTSDQYQKPLTTDAGDTEQNTAGESIYPTRPYEEPRTFPEGGRKEDYAVILSLKTDGYKNLTVKAFNAALEKCTDSFSLDDLARIWEDIRHDDYKAALTDSDKDFLKSTYTLSSLELAAEAKSRNQHTKKQPVTRQQDLGTKSNPSQDSCNFWYQFGYKISDPSRVTIGERDKAVAQFTNELERFWRETSLKQLITMTEKDMLSYMKKTAAKYSSRYLKIIILKDQLLFQPQAGPKDEF